MNSVNAMNPHKIPSRNDDEALVRRVTRSIEKIDYDFSKFTIPGFAQWISAKRGIDIQIDRCDELKTPPGFWFLSEDRAYIKYSSHLPPILEAITILHELLHVYFGHTTLHVSADSIPLIEYQWGIAARDPLQKSPEDKEAEIGAILLYQRIRDGEPGTNHSKQVPDLFENMVDI